LLFSLTHKNASDLHSLRKGLLVTNKGQSAFLSAHCFQGQLQTPQYVTVPTVYTVLQEKISYEPAV